MQIKESPHSQSITGGVKIPVSDGTNAPVHITLNDIRDFVTDDYAPQWTAATAPTLTAPQKIYEIGQAEPTAASFTVSGGTVSKAVSKAGTFTGGAYTDNIEITRSGNTLTATLTRTYASGIVAVKSDKGVPTNRTASNRTTLLRDAAVNSKIDSTTFFIKSETKTASVSCEFVYCVWTNGQTIGTVAKCAPSLIAGVTYAFPAETAQAKHTFDIPRAYTLKGISILNSVSGKYESYGLSNFTTSTVIHKDAAGQDVTYTRYVRNDGTNGAAKFQLDIELT